MLKDARGIIDMATPRHKSPAAPSYALEEALRKAGQIYEAHDRRTVPVDVAAQAMGYTRAKSGPAISSLATLKMFGLLESRGPGRVTLTQAFHQYRLPSNQPTNQQRRIEFVKKPRLFARLLSTYPDSLPSDTTLIYLLVVDMGFTEKRAQAVTQCFRHSIAFAERDGAGPDRVAASRDLNVIGFKTTRGAESHKIAAMIAEAACFAGPIPQMSDIYDASIPVRLAGGRKAWLTLPKLFFECDRDRLYAQINLLHADNVEHDAPDRN